MREFEYKGQKLLSTWDDIFKQIDSFRERSQIDSNYNPGDFYNNISIIGNRGTGKTTILYDIVSKITKDNKYQKDIIFEIITPDIRDEEDILGWIISILKKQVKKITDKNDEYNKNYCPNCRNHEPIDKYINNLEQAYFFRQPSHKKVIINDYSSKIDYLRDNIEKLNADVDLKSSFIKVIDEVVRLIGKKYKPLLIFLFDDVDIHSSRINEVLTSIMNYLSHPNIVNIIAADYDSALENVTIKMLQEDELYYPRLAMLNIIDMKNYKNTALARRQDRSYNLIKKVLPPAYRHYIEPLQSKSKYEIVKDCLEKANIGDGLKSIISEVNNFITEDKEFPIYDYLCFLDDTVRGCINVVKFVISRDIENILQNKNSKKEKFRYLQNLLDVIIESNMLLGRQESRELIDKVINLSQSNEQLRGVNKSILKFNGYINYDVIADSIKRKFNNKDKVLSEVEFELYYKIFILANFFETLIIGFRLREYNGIDKDDEILVKLHGLDVLTLILNSCRKNKPMTLVPNLRSNINDLNDKNNIKELIQIKQNLFQVLRYNEIQQLFNENDYYGYLEGVYIGSFAYKQEIVNYLEKTFERDKEWTCNIIDWLVDVKPNIKKIERDTLIELEGDYGYKVILEAVMIESLIEDEVSKGYSDPKEIIKLLTENNIVNVINEFISLREEYLTTSNIINKAENEIENYQKILDENSGKLNSNFDKKENEINYIKIMQEIDDREEFINNDMNKEIWNNIKNKIIISNSKEKLNDLAGTVVKLHIKDIVKELLSNNTNDEYVDNLEEKEVILKDELYLTNNEVDTSKVEKFIEQYCESIQVIEALKKHPIVINKKYTDLVEKIEDKIRNNKYELFKLKEKKEKYSDLIEDNQIFNYMKNQYCIEHKVENIETEKLLNINKKLKYLYEFIYLFLKLYYTNSKDYQIIKLKYLLDNFAQELINLKEIDIKLSKYVNLSNCDLSKIEIDYFKSRLNTLNERIDNLDIDILKKSISTKETVNNNIIKVKKINEKSYLKELLMKKEEQINSENYHMKMNVFNFAFDLTLEKYLNCIQEQSRYNLENKVRTKYLYSIRTSLEDSVENISSEENKITEKSSFIYYVKSKLE